MNWRATAALDKACGVAKQGAKLSANQLAARAKAINAAQPQKEDDALKLKGEARQSWMLKELKRDSRTDERQIRRILAISRERA